MKKLLYIAIYVLCFGVNICFSAEVIFKWDANTEPDLAGYNLYQSNTSNGQVLGVGAIKMTCAPAEPKTCTQYTHKGLLDGTYYWKATAFDLDGNESGFSDEVSLTIDTKAPGAPQSFTVTINNAKSVSVSVE